MGAKPQARRRVLFPALLVIFVIVAGYLAVSAGTHLFPFSASTSSLSGSSGQLRLLLPGGISSSSDRCQGAQPPSQWSAPGLVQAVHCTDPGLAGGNVYGYELDSAANFQTAWQNFNKWWGFLPGSAGPACPPAATAEGVTISNGVGLDQANRQLTECGTMPSGNGHVPAYAWDLPNSDAFFIAQGAPGSSFSALLSWLTGPATPPFSVPAGVAQLTQLLPSGVADPTADCRPLDTPWDFALPGLVRDLDCTDPNLPEGQVYGFQLDSAANFRTAWQNFNKWWGFNVGAAGSACPPSGNASLGALGWSAKDFPARDGQVLECGTLGGGAVPAFAYAMPTQDAFFVAQGPRGASFTMLNTWWSNESLPAVLPSPASS